MRKRTNRCSETQPSNLKQEGPAQIEDIQQPQQDVEAAGEEEEEGRGSGFFACYLLCSKCRQSKGQTYIEFTVNPLRRIRQHNDALMSGKGTIKSIRPWEMIMCIYGFPTKVTALQFRCDWRTPRELFEARNTTACPKSLLGIINRIKLAYHMLTYPQWRSLKLTVNYFSTEYVRHVVGCKILPRQMSVQFCPMEELPCYTNGEQMEDQDDEDEDEVGDEEDTGKRTDILGCKTSDYHQSSVQTVGNTLKRKRKASAREATVALTSKVGACRNFVNSENVVEDQSILQRVSNDGVLRSESSSTMIQDDRVSISMANTHLKMPFSCNSSLGKTVQKEYYRDGAHRLLHFRNRNFVNSEKGVEGLSKNGVLQSESSSIMDQADRLRIPMANSYLKMPFSCNFSLGEAVQQGYHRDAAHRLLPDDFTSRNFVSSENIVQDRGILQQSSNNGVLRSESSSIMDQANRLSIPMANSYPKMPFSCNFSLGKTVQAGYHRGGAHRLLPDDFRSRNLVNSEKIVQDRGILQQLSNNGLLRSESSSIMDQADRLRIPMANTHLKMPFSCNFSFGKRVEKENFRDGAHRLLPLRNRNFVNSEKGVEDRGILQSLSNNGVLCSESSSTMNQDDRVNISMAKTCMKMPYSCNFSLGETVQEGYHRYGAHRLLREDFKSRNFVNSEKIVEGRGILRPLSINTGVLRSVFSSTMSQDDRVNISMANTHLKMPFSCNSALGKTVQEEYHSDIEVLSPKQCPDTACVPSAKVDVVDIATPVKTPAQDSDSNKENRDLEMPIQNDRLPSCVSPLASTKIEVIDISTPPSNQITDSVCIKKRLSWGSQDIVDLTN